MSKSNLPILKKGKSYNLRSLQSVYRFLNKDAIRLERQTNAAVKQNKPEYRHVCLLSEKPKSWEQVKAEVSEFGKLL